MLPYLSVGLGGAIGAILRFSISHFMARAWPWFPFGTLVSNVLAGFFCGAVVYHSRHSDTLNPSLVLFLSTGFMGGLSTFSTFSVETVDLLKDSKFLLASLNIALNLLLSLLGVLLGIMAAKRLV
jgi:CrcB protein